jgi:hypothetical protein
MVADLKATCRPGVARAARSEVHLTDTWRVTLWHTSNTHLAATSAFLCHVTTTPAA